MSTRASPPPAARPSPPPAAKPSPPPTTHAPAPVAAQPSAVGAPAASGQPSMFQQMGKEIVNLHFDILYLLKF